MAVSTEEDLRQLCLDEVLDAMEHSGCDRQLQVCVFLICSTIAKKLFVYRDL